MIYISNIHNHISAKYQPCFKAKPIVNKNTTGGVLEAVMTASAAYGISQVKNVTHNKENSFIETKSGENILSIVLNTKGEEKSRIIINPSDIAGEYNITQNFPNGKIITLSSVKYDEQKGVYIQKNFVSPDGNRTIYKKSGTNDNYQITYIIKDKNNNIKLEFKREFKMIDANTTETAVNGKRYINKFDVLGVESINLDDPDDKNFMIINSHFEDNMKKMPSEIFYCMRKNKIRLIEDDYDNENNAYTKGNLLILSTDIRNDYFIFAHEIGHIKSDELGDLSKDEELKKIFKKEKAEAIENLGPVLKKETNYFLFNKNGLDEAVAETYAILSGLDHNQIQPMNGMRTYILMQ